MSLTVKSKIGKKECLLYRKKIADAIGIEEGTNVKITTDGKKIIIEPIHDAIWLALHGKKVAKITLEDLEAESVEQQKKYIEQQN